MTLTRFVICVVSLAPAAVPGGDLRDADYARGYFGELVPGLTAQQHESAMNGFRLFVKPWREEGEGYQRNAESCVSCHSVPMPGGSGMSERALVPIDPEEKPGSREERLQRELPSVEIHIQEVRRTPPLFGIGYIEFAESGEQMRDHGVFGKFGELTDLSSFVARAFAIELGVSSSKHCAQPKAANSYPDSCEAAISQEELADIVSYLRFLAPPPRSDQSMNTKGARLFQSIGCAGCHLPVLTTREDAPEPLRSRQFSAYTDLALHDMGKQGPLVTRALWGLNSVGPPYMHDGCGESIAGAILCHNGEGKDSADEFAALTDPDKEALLAYLRGF